MFMLHEVFFVRNQLSETAQITLHYISGCVALKENIAVVELTDGKKDDPSSKVTILSSRGKLIHRKCLDYSAFSIALTKMWRNPALTVCYI